MVRGVIGQKRVNVIVSIYSDVRKQNGMKMFCYIYVGIIISN